jgi:glycerophosphoryl diester phosphodiesterase
MITKKRVIAGIALLMLVWVFWPVTPMDPADIPNQNQGQVSLIGHGGYGFSSLVAPFNPLPANSFGSIKKALSTDIDGIEVDVQMTVDGVFVLYHDEQLGTQTNKEGCIGDLEVEDVISRYTTNDWYHEESIIRLDTLLAYLLSLEQFPELYLDLHSFNYCRMDPYEEMPAYVSGLSELLTTHNVPKEKVHLISTFDYLLTALLKRGEGWRLYYEHTTNPQQGVDVVTRYGLSGLVVSDRITTAQDIEYAHQNGVAVTLFGGSSTSDIRSMLAKGPEVIQVDHVAAALKLLNLSE